MLSHRGHGDWCRDRCVRWPCACQKRRGRATSRALGDRKTALINWGAQRIGCANQKGNIIWLSETLLGCAIGCANHKVAGDIIWLCELWGEHGGFACKLKLGAGFREASSGLLQALGRLQPCRGLDLQSIVLPYVKCCIMLCHMILYIIILSYIIWYDIILYYIIIYYEWYDMYSPRGAWTAPDHDV